MRPGQFVLRPRVNSSGYNTPLTLVEVRSIIKKWNEPLWLIFNAYTLCMNTVIE